MVTQSSKVVSIISLTLLLIITFSGTLLAQEDTFTIGISQLVEHPALDDAREGFIEGLEEEGFIVGENIEILHQNAQADFATAQSIAQQFKRQDVDLILAIATPSAQAAANVVQSIPLLITAVTDPVAAGLVDSLEQPGGNVTGTTDMNPVKEQLELMKTFMPDLETVGVLYNSGEVNSVVQVDLAKEVAPELGLEIKEGTATNTSEIALATSSLVDKVDAFYLPTDNVVASSVASILNITNEKDVPVFASEKGMVENGAIATRGISYFLLGKQTGLIAADVLRGTNPATIPILGSRNFNLVINKTACEEVDLEIPSELLEEADEIIE